MEYEQKARGMPEHMERLEHGGAVCKHCGGEVSEDGYAANMAEGGWAGEQTGESMGGEGEQMEDTEMMRKLGFADAISRRSSSPLPAKKEMPGEHEPFPAKDEDDELEKAKRARYGDFRKAR